MPGWIRTLLMTFSATLVVGSLVAWSAQSSEGYQVRAVMSNAAALSEGSPVLVNGIPAGRIVGLSVDGGKAVVDMELDSDETPLHSGSTALVRWRAALGERQVEITPGPGTNPEIPAGGMVPVAQEQVDVDQVLAALDPPTREHLASTLRGLDSTLKDDPQNVRRFLAEAGPAVGALGEVLKAVGEDGHAIRNLVTDLRGVIDPLAQRDQQLARTVTNLTSSVNALAPQQEAIGASLKELPGTLQEAGSTLDRVPQTVQDTVPALEDARPVTQRLTSVSENLTPVLRDLRPAMAELRPTVASASQLLERTPGLLDSSHQVLPQLKPVVDRLNPAVEYLRPYTPDVAGWLSNWGSAYSYYDTQGHYAGAIIRAGVSSLDENPGLDLTIDNDPRPAPGKASGKPWTDANGSGMR